MHPGDDRRPTRRRRRGRTLAIVAGAIVVVLAVLGVGGFFAFRAVQGVLGGSEVAYDEAGLAGGEAAGPTDVAVERRDIDSTVAATGSLRTSKLITLGFPGSGRLTELTVAVGDTVTAGQVLARQDPRLAQIDLDTARAALAAAERAAGVGGATPAERRAAEARVAEARLAVTAAQSGLERTQAVVDANAVALQSGVDAAARRLERDRAALQAAQAALTAAQAARPADAVVDAAGAELAAARSAVGAARTAATQAGDAVGAAAASGDEAAIAAAQARSDAALQAVSLAEARAAEAEAAVDALGAGRAEVDAARAAVAAADEAVFVAAEAHVTARDAQRSGLASDAQTLDGARTALSQARASLDTLVTGTAAEAAAAGTGAGAGADAAGGGAAAGSGRLSADEARIAVDKAELDVERAQAALDRLTIVAPTDATVTEVKAAVGDSLGDAGAGGGTGGDGAGGTDLAGGTGGTVSAADIITLSTPELLVAQIKVVEADAIKLEAGMPAQIKFSAIPDVVGTGRVLSVIPEDTGSSQAGGFVDPYSQPAQGSQTLYAVSVAVDDLPEGARGGLSIAVRITVGSEAGAIVVPTAAVSEFEGGAVVQRVTADGATEEVPVELGLRQGGFTQVVSGLEEGDQVRIGGDYLPPEGEGGAVEAPPEGA